MASVKTFSAPSLRINVSPQIQAAFKKSLLAWIVVKIVQSLTSLALWQVILDRSQNNYYYFGLKPVTNGWQGLLLGIWQRWDGIHYQKIAETGYSQDYLSVFFPFYPLLSHWISALTGISPLIALLVVSNIMFIGLLVLVNLLATDLFGPEIGQWAFFGAVAFPTAFFFSAIYPQSLALFLILLSYYSFRKEHWALAGFAAFLAGLTHSTVFPLALLFAIEVFQRFRKHNKFQRIALGFIPFLPLFGTALFMAWRIRFGYPNYQQLEWSIWRVGFMSPWQFASTLVSFTLTNSVDFIHWIDIAVLILACIVTVWCFKKLPFSVSIYQLSALVFIVFTGDVANPISSISRYVLIMFPVFFFIGYQTQNKLIRMGVFELCVILQILLTGYFFLWGFVG